MSLVLTSNYFARSKRSVEQKGKVVPMKAEQEETSALSRRHFLKDFGIFQQLLPADGAIDSFKYT